MPTKKVRGGALETAAQRKTLAARTRPYFVKLAQGIFLGYRRNTEGAGTWSVKVRRGGDEWTKKFAHADDHEKKETPPDILKYWSAIDVALKIARGESGDDAGPDGGGNKPPTVRTALDRYKIDLVKRGADPLNATRVIKHSGTLDNRLVSLLTQAELAQWCEGLAEKVTKATANRTIAGMQAALKLAYKNDVERIRNFEDIRFGLQKFGGADRKNNVILTDDATLRVVHAVNDHEAELGLFVETIGATGSRPGQVSRLRIEHLRDDWAKPVVMMPKSGKGLNCLGNKLDTEQIPITDELAAKLRQAAGNRAKTEPLLLQKNGQPWGNNPNRNYRDDFERVVAGLNFDESEVIAGFDPDKPITLYALRHSNIVRMLLADVPPVVVAKHHNTSIAQIEKTYAHEVTKASDAVTRPALLDTARRENVATMERRRKPEGPNNGGRSAKRVDPRHPTSAKTRVASDQRYRLSGAMVRGMDRRGAGLPDRRPGKTEARDPA